MTGFYLSELRLTGVAKKDASIIFKKGGNIISGPSNTGKSFIFECIEYMLGGSNLNRKITESKGYQTIYLELKDYSEKTFTLKSDFDGGDFLKFECPLNEITEESASTILKRKHTPGKKNTLSNFLLKKSNLTDCYVRTNALGKKREMSFRDLRILHLIDELRVPTQSSPFLSERSTANTAEENVLKLLLTGTDDSLIVESIPEKVLANKKGRLEVFGELIKIEEEKLKGKPLLFECKKQLEKLVGSIEVTKSFRDKALDNYNALSTEKKGVMNRIHSNKVRKSELSKLYENTHIVEKQYLSDIGRLKSTIEVGSALINLGTSNCPVCESEVTLAVGKSVVNASDSARAELSKMDGLVSELSKAKLLFRTELDDINTSHEFSMAELRNIDKKINTDIKLEVDLLSKKLDSIQSKHSEVSILINDYERLEYLIAQKKIIDDLIEEAPPKKRNFPKVTNSVMEEISLMMQETLNNWGYPNVARVTYSEDDKDFVISGEKRNLAGKGYRSITYSSFILSLLEATLKKGRGCGVCVIDSPLVTYKKPDTPEGEAISADIADKFYKSIAEVNKNRQVIVIENEDVPATIEGKVHHIHFTKNKNIERYGFIPS